MPKKVYSWSRVVAGDIISFRYKGKYKDARPKMNTVLVMNPKLPYTKKDGTSTFHLIGLKLEERGNIPTIQSKPMLVELLEQIGEIEVVSGEDKIYRVEMESKDTTRSGAKDKVYESIKSEIRKHGIYRTYDRIEAARSSVFLEPIELPRQLRKEFMEEGLSED